MKDAWHEKQGAAPDVLVVGEMDDPQPRAGEVRIRIAFSGVNPGDPDFRHFGFVSPSQASIRAIQILGIVVVLHGLQIPSWNVSLSSKTYSATTP
jgi:NADPH:quinone reductase-like Zn-dependent oxidoreductase